MPRGFVSVIGIITVFIMLASACVGYYFGVHGNRLASSDLNKLRETQLKSKVSDYEDKLSRLTRFENLDVYKPNSVAVNFKCFSSSSAPDSKEIFSVKQNLQTQNREFDVLCISNSLQIVVSSHAKIQNTNGDRINHSIEFYQFKDDGNYTSLFLYQPEIATEHKSIFNLSKWYSNGDIIFSLIDLDNLDGDTRTYVWRSVDLSTKLIEFCNWSIARGTSTRGFNECKSFNLSKDSKYIESADLP